MKIPKMSTLHLAVPSLLLSLGNPTPPCNSGLAYMEQTEPFALLPRILHFVDKILMVPLNTVSLSPVFPANQVWKLGCVLSCV